MMASNEAPPQVVVDEAKANAPPRAVDVYMIASRLKRMITATASLQLALMAGDETDRDKHFREFVKLSQDLEPLLTALVTSQDSSHE